MKRYLLSVPIIIAAIILVVHHVVVLNDNERLNNELAIERNLNVALKADVKLSHITIDDYLDSDITDGDPTNVELYQDSVRHAKLVELVDSVYNPIRILYMNVLLGDTARHDELHELLEDTYHGDTTRIPTKFRMIAC